MNALILAVILANGVSAGDFVFTNKKVNLDKLNAELTAAGFQLSPHRTNCSTLASGERCVISLLDTGPQDPSAVVTAHSYIDPRQELQALLDELATIEVSLDAGSETAAQRRRFMKLLLKYFKLNRRP